MSGYKYIKLTLNERSPLFDARNEILEIAKAHDIYISVKLYELDAYGLAAVAQEITTAIRARSVERSQHFAITESLREAHRAYLSTLDLEAGESNRTEIQKQPQINEVMNSLDGSEAGNSDTSSSDRRIYFTNTSNSNSARKELTKESNSGNYELYTYQTSTTGKNTLNKDITPLGGAANLNLRSMNTTFCRNMYDQALISFMTPQNIDRVIKKPILLIDEPWSYLAQPDVDNALERKIINSKQHKQLTEKLIRKPSADQPEAKLSSVYASDPERTAELKRLTGLY